MCRQQVDTAEWEYNEFMEDKMDVYKAINAVQTALSKTGIAKDKQGNGFKFRGIDDVYAAISPLLAEHRLCIIPRCVSRECVERSARSGGALFYVTVEAEFDFVSAVDGSKHTARTFGEAMDSSDKATNKAMSAAYKYAAFQTFAIPLEGDNDADATTHDVAAKPKTQTVAGAAFEALDADTKDMLTRYANEVKKAFASDPATAFNVYEKHKAGMDSDMQVAFWKLFDSKQRSSIKASGEAARKLFAAPNIVTHGDDIGSLTNENTKVGV